MKAFKILDTIFEIVSPILCFLYGVMVIIFSHNQFVIDNYQIMLGIILMIGGVAKIVDYIGGHKIKHEFNFDLVFGILGIVMGIVVMAKTMSISTVCIIWGVLEILKGAFEIQHLIIVIKHKNYLAFISFGCALLDITFGTLLCIHTEEDIAVHLIVVGIVFIVSAITEVIETILEKKKGVNL